MCADRRLTISQQQRQRREVRQDAEFSMVLDFLEAFENDLELKSEFKINDLEEELINATGNVDGPLQQIHMVSVTFHTFFCLLSDLDQWRVLPMHLLRVLAGWSLSV